MQIVIDVKPEGLEAIKKFFKENFYGDLTEESMRKFIVHNINLSLLEEQGEWYDHSSAEDFFVDEDYDPIWVD